MKNNFICSFCGQQKEYDQLAGELKKPDSKLLAEKSNLEAELVKISSAKISTTEQAEKEE